MGFVAGYYHLDKERSARLFTIPAVEETKGLVVDEERLIELAAELTELRKELAVVTDVGTGSRSWHRR